MSGTDRRIPSLDGARAVSITFVIAAHILSSHTGGSLPFFLRFDYGNLGVRVFFVISGFIITTLLLREHEREGRIDLPAFYVRRFFRIVPAFYALILTATVLIATETLSEHYRQLLPALFYYSNYLPVPLMLDHSWSLSVEEQFYLLWPSALALLTPGRRSVLGCGLLLLTAPVFRVLDHIGVWHTAERYAFETVCDALAAGCLLALLRARLWSIPAYRRVVQSPSALLVPACALLIMALHSSWVLHDLLGIPLLNLGIAVVLDRYMREPQSPLGRVLNSAPIVWVGTLSYSLYLWQQPFAFQQVGLFPKLAAIILCAAGSYYLIERPCLAMRARFAGARRAARVSPAFVE